MVANEFSQAVGREVRVSSRYHSGDRPGPRNQFYVVEPDGSLQGDNDGDEGLEFVSPPMPIDELLKDLNAVKSWAGRMGVYTNESTGLHINISVPNYSIDNLDFVKLALLLGDKYVLEQFGRSSNTYTKSALDLVKNNVRTNPASAQQLLEKMKGNLGQLASKAIHSGVTSKYTSINTKDGHIEFRSPGGDWLDENFDKIENTLLRFTVAMSAALNPEAYREEYLKKLYKLLDPQGGESKGPTGRGGKETIRYFADYVAGKIPQAALRSFVKQAQLERKVKHSNQPMWWKVSNPVHSDGSIEVVATNKQEAIDKALEPDGYPSWAMTRQSVVAEPVRPFEGNPAQTQTDILPNIGGPATQTDMENRLGLGSQSADANYEIVDRRTNRPVFLFIANTPTEAARKFDDWLDSAFDWSDPSTSARHYTWRPRGASQSAQPTALTLGGRPSNPDGNWLIIDRNRRPVYRFMAADQNDAETVWLQWSREHAGTWQLSQAAVPDNTQDSQQSTAQGDFSGVWKIVDSADREVHRFYSASNSQTDANRVAVQWLADNREPNESYTVLPIMRTNEDLSRRGFLGTMGAAAAAAAAPGIAAAGTGVKKPDQSQPASGLGLKMPKEFNLLGNHPQNEITLQKMALGSGLKGSELAQFLGQMKHESWNFEKLKEHPKGQKYFERRYGVQYAPKTAKILGNKYPGDGERYHGRGFVQLTGRENYKRAGAALGIDLLNKPELAENPEIAAKIAMWYWNSRVRPRVKNFADTAAVTKTINPAMRGLEDRDSNFKDYMRLV
jgi:predicted chitinase